MTGRRFGGALRGMVLGFGLGVASLAPAAQAETLTDAMVLAYRNSDLMVQNRALLRAADEDVAVAVSMLRPVFDFAASASYNYNEFRTGGITTSTDGLSSMLALTASLTLYDGGVNRMGVESAMEMVLAARQALIGVEHNVLFMAVQAYMNVRLAEEMVTLRQSNVRVIERELGAAQDRFELGEITRTDVAIAEARLAGARSMLAAAEGDLAVAREGYLLAVGQYPGRLAPPPAPPQLARNLDEAKQIARRGHYSVIQMQHEVKAADIGVARAAAAMGPRVTAQAQYGLPDSGLQSGSVSVGLSQRLYQGGGGSALHRQAMARRDATRSALHFRAIEVEQTVGEAWAQLGVARAAIEATDRQIRAARTAYEGVREEAMLGARTTLDVLNAEQELLDAQSQRLQAVTTQQTAHYALLASMGLLTAEHLGLGVPVYDPDAYYNAVRNAPATSPQGERLDRVLRSIGGGGGD